MARLQMTRPSDFGRERVIRNRRHQMHIWLSDREYAWLTSVAKQNDETISGVIRRVLRLHRLERKPPYWRDADQSPTTQG